MIGWWCPLVDGSLYTYFEVINLIIYTVIFFFLNLRVLWLITLTLVILLLIFGMFLFDLMLLLLLTFSFLLGLPSLRSVTVLLITGLIDQVAQFLYVFYITQFRATMRLFISFLAWIGFGLFLLLSSLLLTLLSSVMSVILHLLVGMSQFLIYLVQIINTFLLLVFLVRDGSGSECS